MRLSQYPVQTLAGLGILGIGAWGYRSFNKAEEPKPSKPQKHSHEGHKEQQKEGAAEEKKRLFSHKERDECWNMAKVVPGRDPERWRYDAVGNVVSKKLISCSGPLCHTYDHVVPYSRGGKTVAYNCQILQTIVNQRKGNKEDITFEQMKAFSHRTSFSDAELDVIEASIYGNVNREK